jgi:tartrate-resistant acid phosphatase type 5
VAVILLISQACTTRQAEVAQNPPDLIDSPTATPLPNSVYTFVAIADATIRSESPARNYGTSIKLETDGSPVKQYLLKFDVTGINGRQILKTTLRLYNINKSSQGGDFYATPDTSWSEGTVTWENAPAADSAPVGSIGPVTPDNWYEVDLTSLVQADGILGLRVTSTADDGADYSSREGDNPPQLIVEVSNSTSLVSTLTPIVSSTPALSQTPTDIPTFAQTPTQTYTPAPSATALTGDAVRFAVIGDYGSGSQAEEDVSTLVKSWNPDFIVSAGDNNYPSGDASTIDKNVGQYYHDFIYPYSGRYGAGADHNRFIPSLGNHDWGNDNIQAYLDYFTLPNNERYYDVIEGPIHFFLLDSDPREPDGTTSTSIQAMWLRDQLAASTSPWNIVVLHHAPYSSGHEHGSNVNLQWPFAEWGADIVLSGHEHTYERLEVDGFPYIVNGLGGASLYTFDAAVAGSLVRYNDDYGALLVEANAGRITFSFHTRTNLLVDTFSLDANSSLKDTAFTPTVSAPTNNTPLPVSTLAPGMFNTGYLSPTTNRAITTSGGDNNGYQTNSAQAYVDDSAVAADPDSGTGASAACTNGTKDKHLFLDFNFKMDPNTVIQGIEVRLDALTDSTIGEPKICVQLSWDGGVTWTPEKSTPVLGTAETTYILGAPTDTWGQAWTPDNFNNTNFRVRVTDVSSDTSRDFFLDYVAVNITYQP